MLLTHGTESPVLFPAVIAELVKLVPVARVEILEGAGHIPHATHPEDWTARLLAFLDQHTRAREQPRS
jgi:pimeloyl-ACP methyl ester carboxylesterase